MNMKNFRELLEERQRLLHKKAVFLEIVEHLGKFLDTDTGPAKTGIRSEGDALVVPQDCVDEERDVFTEAIDKIQETINKIETSMVAENEEAKQQPEKTEEPKKDEEVPKPAKPSKSKK